VKNKEIPLSASDFKPIFPKRPIDSNKGDFGKAVIFGGSVNYSGAVKLAGMGAAAFLSGCGLAALAVPERIADSVLPYVLEATIVPLPDEKGFLKIRPKRS